MRTGLGILLLAVAILTGIAFPARSQYAISPAFDKDSIEGPSRAKGAIIWNHGQIRAGDANPVLPLYLEYLRNDGWDIFKLVRLTGEESEGKSAQALLAQGKKLKASGYKALVSAGQGFGAWISFAAPAEAGQPFDAVLAMAPAAFGEMGKSPDWQKNATQLYPLAQNMRSIPVFVGLFANDNFDPGRRGEALRAIFEGKNQPYVIVDRPPDLSGHVAGNNSAFARKYGPCLVAFLKAAPSLKGRYDCPAQEKREDLSEFSLPDDLSPPPPGGGFLGRWIGMLENKRPIFLQVDKIQKGNVDALYAWGAIGGQPGNLRMTGIVLEGLLLLKGERIKIEATLLDENQLQIRWMRANGRFQISGRLQRSK